MTKPLDFPVVLARVETHVSMKRATDRIRRLERDLEDQNRTLERTNIRMARDLRAAANVQAALLPDKVPHFPGLQLSWTFRPCEELAGDALGIVLRLDDTLRRALPCWTSAGTGPRPGIIVGKASPVSCPRVRDPGSILRPASTNVWVVEGRYRLRKSPTVVQSSFPL